MQRGRGGRGGRGSLFGFDPFGDIGGFGGLGGPQSLISSVFGGRDPFDDPFFNRPFGSPFENMLESRVFGPNAGPPTLFGPGAGSFASPPTVFGPSVGLFSAAPTSGFIEQQEPQHNKRRGPIIEEINSDNEKDDDEGVSKTRDNPRKHSRIDKAPFIEVPDDEADGERNRHIHHVNEFNSRRQLQSQPQPQCFTFQSSSVTYGGANGAYYTKSMASRAGSDGVRFEEFKEADSTTGQANHRVSRGIHNKGHTLARKLNSDGRVDTMQTLHNLNEDEITGFEQAWDGSSGRHLSGWKQSLEGGNVGPSNNGSTNRGGWALPSTQQPVHPQIASGSDGVTAHMQQTSRARADNHHPYMHHGTHGRGPNHGTRGRPRT